MDEAESYQTHVFDGLPLLHEWFLVFDLIAGSPCFDLIALSLQLLDLSLEVVLLFLFL